MSSSVDINECWFDDLAYIVNEHGALSVWENFKKIYPVQYNLLLLASLEIQAKELENLKGNV